MAFIKKDSLDTMLHSSYCSLPSSLNKRFLGEICIIAQFYVPSSNKLTLIMLLFSHHATEMIFIVIKC